MTDISPWQILFVDDDIEVCNQVKEFLESESVLDSNAYPQVEILDDFDDALKTLEMHRFDLVILDVRIGSHDLEREEEAGSTTLEAIRQRRFVPIIFYTGLPHLVRDQETPLVRVVEKTEGLSRLLDVVKGIFISQLPTVNRALIRHLEAVQRDYMWDFVAAHWDKFGNMPDRAALAYLLARRLALSLSGPGIQQLAQDLGDRGKAEAVEGLAHPMQLYVMPSIEASPLSGDLYQGQIGDKPGYWILLTPSCDMVMGRVKAEKVLVASCLRLEDQPEYQKWIQGKSKPTKNKLMNLLKNKRGDGYQPERYFFLPGAFIFPDLIVDFQQLHCLSYEELSNMERLASLDNPFAEALVSRFARYFGRLGTPDLDIDAVMQNLGIE